MKQNDVIVVGAGAAGMMTAYKLTQAGKSVIVLEARNRAGGRIYTLDHASFFTKAELGAEFIHGDLPVTFNLLKEAGLKAEPAEGEMWQYENDRFSQSNMMDDNWDLLLAKLNELQQDMPLSDFLDQYFADTRFEELRASVIRYLGGYDTGDPEKASSFALKEEWQHEDNGEQHRLKDGYCSLISYMAEQCRTVGNPIYLNETVKIINWDRGEVMVTTEAGKQYQSRQVVIALPLGVLQQPEGYAAGITFKPAIPSYVQALQKMGFGSVIKILLQFDNIFWESNLRKEVDGQNMERMGFLFSKEVIPTWWTQLPKHVPLLTGWLAGPPAEQIKHYTDKEILQEALNSLSNIFGYNAEELKSKLVAWHVANWLADPYTCGSYAYDTVASPASRQTLLKGVEETLFFAGEYLYAGTAMGTVEAALTSGKQVADSILNII